MSVKRLGVIPASIVALAALSAIWLVNRTVAPVAPTTSQVASTSPPFLRVIPGPRRPEGEVDTWSLAWDVGDRRAGRVEVSQNGGGFRLLAAGERGSTTVGWISVMSTYDFRLMADNDRAPLVITRLGPMQSFASLAKAASCVGILGIVALIILNGILAARAGLPRWGPSWLWLAVLWVLAAVAINPAGEFPINDDWAYAWSVKMLLAGDGLRLSDWSAANLLPQVLWGALFSLPQGFSFAALRISTLCAGLAALLFTAQLLKATGAGQALVAVGVLLIAINPIYYALSYSFNSDVPAFALFVCAFYALARGLAGSRGWMVLGCVAALIGVLERQSNVVLLPALGAALLTTGHVTWRRIGLACLPTLAGGVCQFVYAHWLTSSGRRPLLYGLQIERLFETFGKGVPAIAATYAANIGVMAVYLGLFLFPLCALAFADRLSLASARQRTASLLGVAALVIAGFLALGDHRMPLTGNILERAGIGQPMSGDFYSPFAAGTIATIHDVWTGLTALGLVGLAIFLGALVRGAHALTTRSLQDEAHRRLWVFAAATLVLLVLAVGGLPPDAWFDRYLLPMLPAAAVLVTLSISHGRGYPFGLTQYVFATASIATLLLFAAFTFATTHDLLASTRARWAGYQDLMASQRVGPEQIDSWDLTGWFFAQRIETCNATYVRRTDQSATWDDFSCLADHPDRRFSIVYRPGDSRVVGEYAYQRWWPAMTDRVFAVRRDPVRATDAH